MGLLSLGGRNMVNSIKQLLRTPFKLLLFFLLVAMSTMLLVFGIYLWSDTTRKLNEAEDMFTTIGTVTQKEDSIKVISIWDAASKSYTNYDSSVYNRVIPDSVLEFEGGDYLVGPEKRPYYGAYLPDHKVRYADMPGFVEGYSIVEFSPVEDCIPDEPVLVNVKNVFLGEYIGSSKQLWYCDRDTESPEPLYAEKTYIANLARNVNTFAEAPAEVRSVYVPWRCIYSSQYDKTGKKIESELSISGLLSCEEVTENFYQTGRGRYWMTFIETLHQLDETIPVLPTESLKLLPAFHSSEANIAQGREITEEEFREGKAVCLITSEFAQANKLSVGDALTLPLYFADYNMDPSYLFGYGFGGLSFSLLNARGELYPVFWEASYEIVGIYRYTGGKQGGYSGATEMARNMVILPSKSVKASDENNIVDFGPMQNTTTSFQIPNGSIDQFEAAFAKAVPESSLLEITYDDNGYEQISGDLKSTRQVAVLLGAIGLLSALSVLMLLLYFFVVKQKKRTAVERSLGMSRRQCGISIISGILLLTIAATAIGSIGGSLLIHKAWTSEGTDQAGYSMKYSNWVQNEADSELLESLDGDIPDQEWLPFFAIPVLLSSFMLIASLLLVNRNLGVEPILLLSTRGD